MRPVRFSRRRMPALHGIRCGSDLAAPPSGEVDHLVGAFRGGEDRRGEPVEGDRGFRGERGPRRDHSGPGIERDMRGVGEAQRVVAEDQLERAGFRAVLGQAERRGERSALPVPGEEARLAGKGRARFGTDREIGIAVEHAARHVPLGEAGEGSGLTGVDPGPPIDDLRQAARFGGEHEALVLVFQDPGRHVIPPVPDPRCRTGWASRHAAPDPSGVRPPSPFLLHRVPQCVAEGAPAFGGGPGRPALAAARLATGLVGLAAGRLARRLGATILLFLHGKADALARDVDLGHADASPRRPP